jgi:hypothetical protein
LQRLCFGPDVAAADVDRGENRDLGKATAASKKQLTEEARLENGPFETRGLDADVEVWMRSCVRPVGATMAAGPDEVRERAPNKLAASGSR